MTDKLKTLRAGLEAAIRAANLALFVIKKQNVMPNSSWKGGFEKDLKIATAALEAATLESSEYVRGLEDAAKAAEEWEPVVNLLPLCNESDNEVAMTGQWEARERIVDAIRAIISTISDAKEKP